MGDAKQEHASRLLSCYSVRSLLFAIYYGFRVDEADAAPLLATCARPIPVESKNAPVCNRSYHIYYIMIPPQNLWGVMEREPTGSTRNFLAFLERPLNIPLRVSLRRSFPLIIFLLALAEP